MKSPTAIEIIDTRHKLGLTQKKAAESINKFIRTWQRWEYGESIMPSELWELFLLKHKSLLKKIGNE